MSTPPNDITQKFEDFKTFIADAYTQVDNGIPLSERDIQGRAEILFSALKTAPPQHLVTLKPMIAETIETLDNLAAYIRDKKQGHT